MPLSVSVVKREQIDESEESALMPILNGQVPGLFITERGITGFGVGAGAAGQISIRGIGGNPTTGVLMLIDGHPQFMGIMGHPLPDTYVASDVERVEVIRGPASVLYGSNAMGGVINIITRKQNAEGLHGNARLLYGTYNTLKYMAAGGIKKGAFSLFVSGNHDQTDGHRKNSEFRLNNGYLKLSTEPSSHFYASADLNLTGFKAGDPGPDTLHALPGQKIDITRGYASLFFQHEFEKLSGSAKLFYNFGEHNITDGFHSRDHNYGLNLTESIKLFPRTDLTLGADALNYGGIAENLKANMGKGILFADTSVVETGFYGFAQQTLPGKLTLNFGLRYQHHNIYGEKWIPSGGFSWELGRHTTWKGLISKGFRSPTIRELFLWGPNPKLMPENVINYETGFLQSFPNQNLNVELTFFTLEGDNIIVNIPLKGLMNSGQISNRGIEMSAGLRLSDRLNLNATYSFNHMEKPLFATPEHLILLGSQFRAGKFLFSANIQQIVNIDTDPSMAVTKESYTLLKAKVTCHLGRFLQVYISGENLLDQVYEVNRYYPMPGITLFSGVNFTI